MKRSQQILGFLAVQPYFLTVGQRGGFKTASDFYKFAAKECGFEAVTLPAGDPFVDMEKAAKSAGYCQEFQAQFHKWGLEYGVRRLEMHVVGQNVCLHPSRVLRFGSFLDPQNFRKRTHRGLEEQAADQMMGIIDVSSNFGFRHIPGFCGGRGYAIAQAKWSAWPKHLPLWVLGLLAFKWEKILEYAADRKQVITFEIGHPENDLLTGANFVAFYKMLSKKARKGVGVNGDASHYLNVGTNPLPHFEKADETGCEFTNHYKWGASVDRGDGRASVYGGWDPWSQASTSFYTFGTVGSVQLAEDYHAFMEGQHETQRHGVDIIYEGECVAIKNPKQAMEVGAHNCRAIRDGNTSELIRVEDLVDPGLQDILLEADKYEGVDPYLDAPNNWGDELEDWAGGPFDAFADSPVLAPELLAMDAKETMGVMKILERAGRTKALDVGKKYLKML